MKTRFKTYTFQFIKEIIPVVAGILIALFIDNWNSERKDKAYIEQVFSTINSELNDSKEDIIAIMPKQKSLVDSLDFYADDTNVSIADIVKKCKGIYIPQVKINAWKAVANTKIDLVDYKKITSLSNLEELKQILSKKTDFVMNFLYTNINTTDQGVKHTFKIIVLDIIQTENSMLQNIEAFKEY